MVGVMIPKLYARPAYQLEKRAERLMKMKERGNENAEGELEEIERIVKHKS